MSRLVLTVEDWSPRVVRAGDYEDYSGQVLRAWIDSRGDRRVQVEVDRLMALAPKPEPRSYSHWGMFDG